MPNKIASRGRIDPDSISVTNDPYEPSSTNTGSKFDTVFKQAQQGQRLKCNSGDAARIANQFKKYLARQHPGRKPIVRSKERCKDDMGGIWWLGFDVATTMAALPPTQLTERSSRDNESKPAPESVPANKGKWPTVRPKSKLAQ